MKHFFVINPHSFRIPGSMEQVLADISKVFSDGQDHEIYMSRYTRDAIAAVHHYIRCFSPEETVRVYAVGGDGILFDCLNGMADFPSAEITNVPYGKANDFVRAFGNDVKRSFCDIKKLSQSPSQLVDTIYCGSNYAINEVAVGIAAECVLIANTMFRSKRAKLYNSFASQIYSLGAIMALLNEEIMRQQYRVILDDDEDVSGNYCNITISNGPCNGGSMIPNPYARANDGMLDVIFTASDKTFTVLKNLNDYNKGYFEKHKMFFRKRCKKIELESKAPIRVHMDGEAFCTDALKAEIKPAHIRFFAPEGMDFADYSHRAYRGNTAKGRLDK